MATEKQSSKQRVSTPFNPSNIIIGDKELSVYVGTILREFMMGHKHLELVNRGYKGRQRLFQLLEVASASIPFQKISLISIANVHTIAGSDEQRPGWDNRLVLDLASDVKVEGQ